MRRAEWPCWMAVCATGDRKRPLGRSLGDDKRGGIIGTGGWLDSEASPPFRYFYVRCALY